MWSCLAHMNHCTHCRFNQPFAYAARAQADTSIAIGHWSKCGPNAKTSTAIGFKGETKGDEKVGSPELGMHH
jgi:hypothetical protein